MRIMKRQMTMEDMAMRMAEDDPEEVVEAVEILRTLRRGEHSLWSLMRLAKQIMRERVDKPSTAR